ncbi:MAG: hypothetical protein VKL39_07490 [Leptolyngbyaceae bacterium]|nr:hypothetical protein [Leptolyngbyaceae bacterium]
MLRSIAPFFIALIFAGWSVAIAILSVQNAFVTDENGDAQLIVLKFLGLQSIQMPFGVALVFAFAIGMVVTAGVLSWVGRSPHRRF